MKFVLACYGMRGDVEPSVVVGRELMRRGHEVRIAMPPNLVGFAESAGLAAVAYGLDSRALVEVQREYWTCFFRIPWKLKELDRLGREISEFVTQCWREVTHADAAGGRGGSTHRRPGFRAVRCQCRGVLRPSVGHAAFLPDAGQRPAPAIPAGAVGPLRNEGVRAAVSGWCGEEG